MKISILIVISSIFIYMNSSYAGDCPIRQLPDGSYTTDCPSEVPSIPAPPQAQYTAACEAHAGVCSVTFDQYVPTGTACYCMTNDGNQINGSVSN